MGESSVTAAATIALSAMSLAVVSLTLSLFAWEARPGTVDDKANRQAPFIQSGVMTRDKQPTASGLSRHSLNQYKGAVILLIFTITLTIIIIIIRSCSRGVGRSSQVPAGKRTSADSVWMQLKGSAVFFAALYSFTSLN